MESVKTSSVPGAARVQPVTHPPARLSARRSRRPASNHARRRPGAQEPGSAQRRCQVLPSQTRRLVAAMRRANPPLAISKAPLRLSPRFRTIQVYPKDLRLCPWQAEHAAERLLAAVVCWYHEDGRRADGTRTGPSVRHQAARIHHVSWRGRGGVAARRDGAASRTTGGRVRRCNRACRFARTGGAREVIN
jgi:hypothetical protein